MLVVMRGVVTSVEEGPQAAIQRALETLGPLRPHARALRLVRTSVDARHGQVRFVCSVAMELSGADYAAIAARQDLQPAEGFEPVAFEPNPDRRPLTGRPVVVGFGPAGIFAALELARNGYRPVVFERGAPVDERVRAVRDYWDGGALNPAANVQFGEGGAGTFSDGKLTTRIGSPLCRQVLTELVRHGAPDDILIAARPHVGTDLLRGVVKSLRGEILALGGEVHFGAQVKGFCCTGGALRAVSVDAGEMETPAAVVAVGHSARDTFEAIAQSGVTLIPKAFSVGVRIEHLQSEIDRALYGRWAGHPNLPPGEYQLSHRDRGRAAYTFCMCPGGMVVAAASQPGQVVTNGMSLRARSLPNANAALAVSVDSADYGPHWRDAVAFQQALEEAAFTAGGADGKAPATTVGALLKKPGGQARAVEFSYPIGVKEYNITELFPRQIGEFLLGALPVLGRRLSGFDSPAAALTGVETRTSSPVRMPRGADFCAKEVRGIYPCGEGAGYAGGIVSAAVDGIRTAQALMRCHAPCVRR